jgi:two-component system heavy metal sensor histidine kinase CusS
LHTKQIAIEHLIAESRNAPNKDQLQHAIKDLLAGHDELTLCAPLVANLSPSTSAKTCDPAFRPIHMKVLDIRGLSGAQERQSAALVLNPEDDLTLLRDYRRLVLAALITTSFVAITASFGITRKLTKSLSWLVGQVRTLDASGTSEIAPDVTLPNELQPIVQALNAAQMRLRESRARLDAFNHDVAHELKTPLANLRLGLEMELSSTVSEPIQAALTSFVEEADRLGRIVNDMLFLSRADRKAAASSLEKFESGEVVARLRRQFEGALLQANLRLVTNGALQIIAVEGLFERGLSNLMSNAIRYADPGSTVTVDVKSLDSGWTEVCVANFGTPVSAPVAQHMFDRFYRADGSRLNSTDHHGLGLAIVAGIAAVHGGAPFVHCEGRRIEVGWRWPSHERAISRTEIA